MLATGYPSANCLPLNFELRDQQMPCGESQYVNLSITRIMPWSYGYASSRLSIRLIRRSRIFDHAESVPLATLLVA